MRVFLWNLDFTRREFRPGNFAPMPEPWRSGAGYVRNRRFFRVMFYGDALSLEWFESNGASCAIGFSFQQFAAMFGKSFLGATDCVGNAFFEFRILNFPQCRDGNRIAR